MTKARLVTYRMGGVGQMRVGSTADKKLKKP